MRLSGVLSAWRVMIMIKPTGYYVLVKMEVIEKKDGDKIEGSNLIIAAPKAQKDNRDLAEREQKGHFRGTIVSLGPTAWSGFQCCEGDTAEKRSEQWGCKVGDTVRFQRYDGVDEGDEYRLVQDAHIIGVIED